MPALLIVWGIVKIIPWQIWLILILALAFLGAVAFYHHKWETAGYNAAITAVDKANVTSKAQATKATNNVQDCISQGGEWDRLTGRCVLP